MNHRDRFFEQMVLAYYGELPPNQQRAFERELQNDSELARAYAELCRDLDSFEPSTATPKALPDDSDEMWVALEYNIKRRIRAEQRRTTPLQRWWEAARSWLMPVLRPAVAIAGIAGAYALGMMMGTSQQQHRSAAVLAPSADTPTFQWASPAAALPTAAADPVSNFLKRSQLYIATTADKQLKCQRCIPIERQIDHRQFAHELLKEAQRLRPLAHHNPKVKKVLQDVELVLANLAKDPRQIPPAQLELLHNIASTTICEVNTTIEPSDDNHHEP